MVRTALQGFFYSLTNKLYLMCHQSFHLGNSSFIELKQTVSL